VSAINEYLVRVRTHEQDLLRAACTPHPGRCVENRRHRFRRIRLTA
jgi:hypothetical protein